LFIILIGSLFVLPAIIGYTLLSYWIFRGKAQELKYD
jgi:cytochrome d ubiquinol oxidase subunit II